MKAVSTVKTDLGFEVDKSADSNFNERMLAVFHLPPAKAQIARTQIASAPSALAIISHIVLARPMGHRAWVFAYWFRPKGVPGVQD
ncbi:MAG TPA: hypothetical protein VIN38_04095 [Thiobacillus sp.]